jgi:hypothetical protein
VSYLEYLACRCGPRPERCVDDEDLLTQGTWKAGRFINQPRENQLELSMLRGSVSVADCCEYMTNMLPVSDKAIAKAGRRRTTARELRIAGFAVVHTPGSKISGNIHVSIIWPPDDPIHVQATPWPPEVTGAFDACFNGDEGRSEP